MVKKLRTHILENPDDNEPIKWRISKEKIGKLCPNCRQFFNEKKEVINID